MLIVGRDRKVISREQETRCDAPHHVHFVGWSSAEIQRIKIIVLNFVGILCNWQENR